MVAREDEFDIIQIGYGPVGQMNAALLGSLGYRVAVFDKHNGLYALPRAGHVDHEIMRAFQSVDAVDDLIEDAFRCSKYGWRNQHGETLIEIDWDYDGVSGWSSDYLIYQPIVERALDAAVRRSQAVSVNHGWSATGLAQNADFVELELSRSSRGDMGDPGPSERRVVRGRYLVGADGANSFVRQSLGIPLVDKGFNEQWLVTDFRQKRDLHFEFDNGQICDPHRPMCLFQLGKTHRRFEFMVMPHDDHEALKSDGSVWGLVKDWIGPDDAELIRAQIYTFRSAHAAEWRSGRVFLIGDAAHLMPPFLGQGMCSGVRDACSLAWRLDLVLKGLADDSLLDTYMLERKPHVDAITEQAVALGRVSCLIDPEAAAQRDAALLSGNVPAPPPFPSIASGFLSSSAHPANRSLRGRLGPQGRIGYRQKEGLADDLVGSGWQLLLSAEFVGELGLSALALIQQLGIVVLDFREAAANRAVDVEGSYRRFFSETDTVAILVRPDFYIFGGLGPRDDIDEMFADLASKLTPGSAGSHPL